MSTTEYDAFGPWILEIDKKNPVPPLFEPYVNPEEYQMLIKVPRKIERRRANPNMHLYDYVVGISGDQLHLFKRHENTASSLVIQIDEIMAIENSSDLLAGRVRLFMKAEIIAFDYNTVSEDIILRFLDCIRKKYIKTGVQAIDLETADDSLLSSVEVYYRNLLTQYQQNGDCLKILAFQPQSRLQKNSGFIFEKYWNLMMGYSLHSSLYLTNQLELVVVHKGKKIQRTLDAEFGYTTTYIPFNRIEEIILENNLKYKALQNIRFSAGIHQFSFHIMIENTYIAPMYQSMRRLMPRDSG